MATIINMLEAKTYLSKLVDSLERGQQDEFVIARNGRPAARLVPLSGPGERSRVAARRLGIAKGEFVVPEDIDGANGHVADLFSGH